MKTLQVVPLPSGVMFGGRDLRRLPWKLRYEKGGRFASDTRRLLVQLTHQHCTVQFNGPVRLGPGFQLDIPDRGTFIVGAAVDFRRGFVCEISGDGRVVIGDHSTFTSHTLIQCTTSIEIGKRCQFGQSTLIVDGNHRFREWTKPLNEQGYDYRPIHIDDDAVVTTKCTIIANIGKGAFIGANSVVTKDIPAYCLATGAPATPKEYFGPPDQRPPGVAVRG